MAMFVWVAGVAHAAFQFGALLRDGRLISETAFYFPSFFFYALTVRLCAAVRSVCVCVF